MYDMPGISGINDRLWQAIRAHLERGPSALSRSIDAWEAWRAPDLIFAQTCGFPYRAALHDHVQIIGTPDYGLQDCAPGYYRSAFVARAGSGPTSLAECAGKTMAFNEPMSQSGWAAPMHMLNTQSVVPSDMLQTGAHVASLRAVADGHADFAAVDVHTLDLLRATGTCPEGLTTIAQTDETPGLPYICARAEDATALRYATEAAIADLGPTPLGLHALVQIPAETYLAVPTPPSPAQTGLPFRQLSR